MVNTSAPMQWMDTVIIVKIYTTVRCSILKRNNDMREFNLEESKRGHPVICRNGYESKIYDFDIYGEFPIVGYIITKISKTKYVARWNDNGCHYYNSDLNLMMDKD